MTTLDDPQLVAQLRRNLHELEQNWCDLVNTLTGLVDIEPDVDDFDPATSIAHELITLRDQLTHELERTSLMATQFDALDAVRAAADAVFHYLTSEEQDDELWSHEVAARLMDELAGTLAACDRPREARLVRARLTGSTVQDLRGRADADDVAGALDELATYADEHARPFSRVRDRIETTATLLPPTTVEPSTIDEARQQMIHDLHHAVYGFTQARAIPPAAVWTELLDVVRTSIVCACPPSDAVFDRRGQFITPTGRPR